MWSMKCHPETLSFRGLLFSYQRSNLLWTEFHLFLKERIDFGPEGIVTNHRWSCYRWTVCYKLSVNSVDKVCTHFICFLTSFLATFYCCPLIELHVMGASCCSFCSARTSRRPTHKHSVNLEHKIKGEVWGGDEMLVLLTWWIISW